MRTQATFNILLALFHFLSNWLGSASSTPSGEVFPCTNKLEEIPQRSKISHKKGQNITHLVHLKSANANIRIPSVSVSTKVEQKFPSGEIFVSNVWILVLIFPPRKSFLQAFLTLDILPRTMEHKSTVLKCL